LRVANPPQVINLPHKKSLLTELPVARPETKMAGPTRQRVKAAATKKIQPACGQ
jgi:hypothetical protein